MGDSKYVEMDKGYLVLNSKEAIDLYNELTTSGGLFEQLSVLFNEYALNKDKTSKLETQIADMSMIMSKMVQSFQDMKQLPLNENNHTKMIMSDSQIIETEIETKPAVKVTTAKPKSKGSSKGFKSLASKMSKFK